MAVHDVYVNPVGAAFVSFADLFSEACEVSG
jgi:hypothetical protein